MQRATMFFRPWFKDDCLRKLMQELVPFKVPLPPSDLTKVGCADVLLDYFKKSSNTKLIMSDRQGIGIEILKKSHSDKKKPVQFSPMSLTRDIDELAKGVRHFKKGNSIFSGNMTNFDLFNNNKHYIESYVRGDKLLLKNCFTRTIFERDIK